MKKISYLLSVIFVLSSITPVYAVVGGRTPTSSQDVQIQNKNEVNTQNQGEDSKLQINTQEQDGLVEKQEDVLQNRNQNATQSMSETSKYVQQLLQVRTTGGLGEEVRQFAREQDQSRVQIQEQLDKLESKGTLARFITGTNYQAVNNLKAQLEKNQLRIEQLEQLQNQLSDQEDVTMVQEAIQALIQENISLQEMITNEEQVKSLLGWLFKLFAK